MEGVATGAHSRLDAFLKETLKDAQLQRLRELVLQREGPFAFLQSEVAGELKLRDEQRQQCITVIQELQKKVEPLMKAIQSGGAASEIVPKIHELRREYATRLEQVLNETQRVQWKKMLGKPMELDE